MHTTSQAVCLVDVSSEQAGRKFSRWCRFRRTYGDAANYVLLINGQHVAARGGNPVRDQSPAIYRARVERVWRLDPITIGGMK